MSGFAVDHHLAVAVGDIVGNAFLRIELLVVLIKILVCNPGADTYIAVRRLKITHDRANERGLARAALNKENEIIGYEFVNLGKLMAALKDNPDVKASEIVEKLKGHYGQWDTAAKYIDPRKE